MDPAEPKTELPSLLLQVLFYVWPKYRRFWYDMNAIVPESTFQCVQCEADYMESENVDGSCAFHSAFFDGDDYVCCYQTEPCKLTYCWTNAFVFCVTKFAVMIYTGSKGIHRNAHHSEYKYSNFYEWMWSINSEPRMHEEFAAVSSEDFRLSDGGGAFADCGAVLSAHPTDANKFYIRLFAGRTQDVMFKVYSKDDLESIEPQDFHIGHVEGLPSGLKDGLAHAEAKWLKVDAKIVGLTITCRTATSKSPSVTEVYFSFPDNESGPVLSSVNTISISSFGELKIPNGDLSTAYPTLPSSTKLFQSAQAARLKLPVVRSTELFQSITTNGSPLSLTLHSLKAFQPFQANLDRFAATIVIENESSAPTTVLQAKGYWRMRSSTSESWDVARIESVEVAASHEYFGGELLPTTVNGGQKIVLLVQLDIPRGEGGDQAGAVWRDHSFVARLGPVLIDGRPLCFDYLDLRILNIDVALIYSGVGKQ
jgi:hypothetical protein